MLLEELGHCLGFVKSGVMERRLAGHVARVDIGAMIDQQLRDRCLIGVRGGVKRSGPPMLVLIRCVDIGFRFYQERNDVLMTFPRGAMQWR